MKKFTLFIIALCLSAGISAQKSKNTKQDSLRTPMEHIGFVKECIGNSCYYKRRAFKSNLVGIGIGVVGTAAALSAAPRDKIYMVPVAVGFIFIARGLVFRFQSFKWMERASIYPAVTRDGATLIYHF